MNGVADVKGFTLIEVMIAMAVLSIGIFALYSMQIKAIQGNATAKIITQTSNGIRSSVEELLNKDYGASEYSVGAHSVGGEFPIRSIDWIVTEWRNDGISNDGDLKVDEFDERGVKAVRLTVQYEDRGRSKNTEIYFLKTEIF